MRLLVRWAWTGAFFIAAAGSPSMGASKGDPLERLSSELYRCGADEGPAALQRAIADHIGSRGLQRTMVTTPAGPALLLQIPGRVARPHVLLWGHTQLPAAAAAPQASPERLSGPGMGDMVASLAIVAQVLRDRARVPQGERGCTVSLLLCTDGGTEQALGAIEAQLGSALSFQLVLVPEPTEELVLLGARGRYVVDLTLQGSPAPAARPHLGVNAIEDAARVVTQLNKTRLRQHELLGRGVLTVGSILGGQGSGLGVPERCTLRLVRHVVPGEDRRIVVEDLQKAFEPLQLRTSVRVEIDEAAGPQYPAFLTERSPLVRLLLGTLREQEQDPTQAEGAVSTSGEGRVVYGESAGDYNVLGARWPTAVYGPIGGEFGTPAEWVDVRSLRRVGWAISRVLTGIDSQLARAA